jgi:uncharacterized protein YdhG (YjbR/CyaY superfamily)
MKNSSTSKKKAEQVNEFMEQLVHPFKDEVEALRKIIKNVNKRITEEIKWKAPSYRINGGYLVTFNLREQKRIHLVFHNPLIAKVKSELLQGEYADRRMTYFTDMQDVKAKSRLSRKH